MCIHWLGLTSSEDFVSYEEAGSIIIPLEFIYDPLKGRQLSFVPVGIILSRPIVSVCPYRLTLSLDRPYLLNLCSEGVQIHKQEYSSISKCRHAVRVVLGAVDMVNAYRVGTELLHQGSIELTLGVVDKRVIWEELIGNSCRPTVLAGSN